MIGGAGVASPSTSESQRLARVPLEAVVSYERKAKGPKMIAESDDAVYDAIAICIPFLVGMLLVFDLFRTRLWWVWASES